MKAPSIFISYRRSDSAGHALNLHARLSDWFGADEIYFDRNSLDAGVVFPPAIDQAVRDARITLALIGPDWLHELNRRAAQASGPVDLVRHELKLALELQHADQPGRWVIPVLMDCAMPALPELHPALQGELGPLWDRNAKELRLLSGTVDDRNDGIRQLIWRLREIGRLQAVPTVSDAARLEAARQTVAEALASVEMAPVLQKWGPDPLRGSSLDGVLDLVVKFAKAVEGGLPAWKAKALSTDQLLDVKRQCTIVLSALCSLSVDGPAAGHGLSTRIPLVLFR